MIIGLSILCGLLFLLLVGTWIGVGLVFYTRKREEAVRESMRVEFQKHLDNLEKEKPVAETPEVVQNEKDPWDDPDALRSIYEQIAHNDTEVLSLLPTRIADLGPVDRIRAIDERLVDLQGVP